MPRLSVSVGELIPEVEAFEEDGLEAAAQQVIIELQRQISKWPVDSGRSKYGFNTRIRGNDIIIGNDYGYAYWVNRGELQDGRTTTNSRRNRRAVQRTVGAAPARQRIIRAAMRRRPYPEPSQTAERQAARRARDEELILSGGPDSRLSREGRLREAARRRKNYRNRRRYRLARVINDNATVRPWERLTGAEINLAARLANSIVGDLSVTPAEVLAEFARRRAEFRVPASTLLAVARRINQLAVF